MMTLYFTGICGVNRDKDFVVMVQCFKTVAGMILQE